MNRDFWFGALLGAVIFFTVIGGMICGTRSADSLHQSSGNSSMSSALLHSTVIYKLLFD